MPIMVQHSPPPLHQPGEATKRPKGILKNPSFSGPSGHPTPGSPLRDPITTIPSAPIEAIDSKEITLQNTLQNAGHRRSSSAARRASASRRQSQAAASDLRGMNQDELKGMNQDDMRGMNQDDHESMRLKWDEANLFLAEQGKTAKMKITEPKTPYEYARDIPPEDEEEDVSIDPKYVNVDEMEMPGGKRRSRQESAIPGLELGEPEEEFSMGANDENDRIFREGGMSREGSLSSVKHVSVSGSEEGAEEERVGMPTKEEMEKHRQFEERRKRHYEMSDVRGLLGHPEDDDDEMDEDDDTAQPPAPMTSLPNRGVNGAR